MKVHEKFLDIPLHVEGFKGVRESLDDFFQPEEIEGVNCEVCLKQTMQTKGPQINRLPPVLTFCLNRIKYDMRTWDRMKVNDKFEYPLELDMSKYLEQTEEAQAQKADADLINYELKAILIHIGGPYGGHYHAYIRDDLNEGVWNLQVPDFGSKAENEKDQEDENEEEEAEEEKVDWSKLTKK